MKMKMKMLAVTVAASALVVAPAMETQAAPVTIGCKGVAGADIFAGSKRVGLFSVKLQRSGTRCIATDPVVVNSLPRRIGCNRWQRVESYHDSKRGTIGRSCVFGKGNLGPYSSALLP